MSVRVATGADVVGACRILNEIIDIGGTTAFESPFSESDFEVHFLTGDDCRNCNVYTDQQGDVLGFQVLKLNQDLPDSWLDIATFAQVLPKVKGVGTALFQQTLTFAKASNTHTINATIRADNVPGLAYYSKLGFVDYHIEKAVPLSSGPVVDRISKRFEVPSA